MQGLWYQLLGINLNAQHLIGMTHFDLALHMGKLVKNTCAVI